MSDIKSKTPSIQNPLKTQAAEKQLPSFLSERPCKARPHLNSYPRVRMRRNRTDAWVRRMVSENAVTVDDLIWPVFVVEGKGVRQPINAMPGVNRLSIDTLVEEAKRANNLGIPAIAIFPVVETEKKNAYGDESWNPENLICRAIRTVKQALPNIGIITDVALDPFTDHGHDGILEDGRILNDETLEILAKQALVQARAGADVIAPSDMMDGRVGFIRDVLDNDGHEDVKIMSYAAKYASAYYGPFRDAINSGGLLKGDKASYQMDPANSNEAMREIELDIHEGADMVMIKPGLPYMDIIQRVKSQFQVPTLAYNVSGEYAMLKAASDNGWLDYNKALMEMLLSFKRAGADAILTYAALDAAKIIHDEKDIKA